MCVLNDGDLIYTNAGGTYSYSLIKDQEYQYQPVNGSTYVGCIESSDSLSQDDKLISNNGENQLIFENGSFKLWVDGSTAWNLNSSTASSLAHLSIQDGSITLSEENSGRNPKLCLTDSGDLKMFADKSLGDREYTATQWAASHQSSYTGPAKFTPRGTGLAKFDTSDIDKWNNYGVSQSNGGRSVPLKLKDVSHTADAVTDGSQLGVGYSYAFWLHPLVLAEEYTAYLLCYEWDSDENEADRFWENIPPATLELGENGIEANFQIPSNPLANRCLVEISANKEPDTVVFRKKGLHIVNGKLSINEVLDFVETNPPVRKVEEIEVSGPNRMITLDSDEIDQLAADLQKYEAANEYLEQECASDSESLECKGAGTLLLRALGTAGSGLSVDYSHRCKPESGSEIVDTCFEDENIPSIAGLNPYFEGTACESDSQVDCTFNVQLYRDDFLGSDIDPITLYEMKNLKISYYKAQDGTIYVKNDCFANNTKRKMFIDTIKAPIFLYNFCYKLI